MKRTIIFGLIFMMAIISVNAATVSHSAAQITPGAFAVGNYWFPSGNIGVGTDNPNELFHVKGVRGAIALTDTNSFTDSNDHIYLNPANDELSIGWYDNSAGTNTDLMTIEAAGNVGIGTIGPDAKLDIKATGSNLIKMRRVSDIWGFALTGSNEMGLYDYQNSNYIMWWQENGNVGIGTIDPTRKLVVSSATDTIAKIETTTTTADTMLYFGDSAREDSGRIRYAHTGDFMAFHTNDVEQVTIDSSGNMDVAGNVHSDNYREFYRATDGAFTINMPAQTMATIMIKSGSTYTCHATLSYYRNSGDAVAVLDSDSMTVTNPESGQILITPDTSTWGSWDVIMMGHNLGAVTLS